MLREVDRQRAAHAVAEEASHVAAHGTAKRDVVREVRAEHFDEDLQNEPRFTTPVVRWLEALFAFGARKTVAKAIQ